MSIELQAYIYNRKLRISPKIFLYCSYKILPSNELNDLYNEMKSLAYINFFLPLICESVKNKGSCM